MVTIQPFAALRPSAEMASRVCELPYDVMSSAEAREIARGNPWSFLRVSKPEIDLPEGIPLDDARVYAKGRENFNRLRSEGVLRQDAQPNFYLYQQVMGSHRQVGLVAVASCDEYLRGIIKKHELTRPDKEDDRVRHIEVMDAQTGPVFLTYRSIPAVDALVAQRIGEKPVTDFTAADGVRHTAWVLSSPADVALITAAFSRLESVYIADGHHRSAAAARVFQSRVGAGQSARFLCVIFPHEQMQILPYNRLLSDLNGLSVTALQERLDAVFLRLDAGQARPTRKHQVSIYLAGQWQLLQFRPEWTASAHPIDRLDVSLLQTKVLQPIFGIDDPRTSQRIQFVGGIRGTAELEQRVNRGESACAFSMFPTSIEDLMQIADAGGIMPPKSTWFEPKLRDAMFCHLL